MDVNKKILLVCHGNKHSINGNDGHNDKYPFMMSMKMLRNAVTLDEDPICDPDILENFNLPTSVEENTFSLAHVVGWPMPYILSWEDEENNNISNDNEYNIVNGIMNNTFTLNLIKVVEVNGYIAVRCSMQLNDLISCILDNEISKFKWANGITFSEEELLSLSNSVKDKTNGTEIFYSKKICNLFGLFMQHRYPQLRLLQTEEDINEYSQVFLSKYFRKLEDEDDYPDVVEYQIDAILDGNCDYLLFKKTF